MNDSANREVEIFTEALPLPSVERAVYLERVCGGDTKLRHRIETLLHTHERVHNFLEQSPEQAAVDSRKATPAGEKPGDRIGRYKLLQQIGEGGYGVVFMAEQEEPVRRRVALKIIKPGMDTKNVIARFEAERQAVALMDHPNIAKIFDAGATESGRPFFVMELVRGVKITEFCDQNSLTTEQRLKLFIQVCQAIQHAHQKGIIHRDIKPSNILVTCTQEGTPLPIVIDFGIAKATTNQRLTDKTVFTAFEMLIGTPAYMSPEQAALTSVDVDTRTDIYSLGVLLYELLTSLTPFDTGELLKVGLNEVRRVILEVDPISPSMRLSRMAAADLTTIAQRRQSEPPKLIRTVSGDLDWIVLKALEKNRTRRYETANGLALDVQRVLDDEPISARPPSRVYKFQKMVRRNLLLCLGLGTIAMILVAGLVAVSSSLHRERQARLETDAALRQAKADEASAQTEAAKSEQVKQFLEDMLRGVGPSVALGRDTTLLREILNLTSERVGKELTNQPAVEAELRGLIGRVYLEIGSYAQAEEMERAALDINRRQFGPNSKEVGDALNDLGAALWRQGKLVEPEACYQKALAIRQQLLGDDNPNVADSLANLSDVYRHQGRAAEAEALSREALRIRQKFFGKVSLPVADSLRSLSIISGDKGNWAEAESLAREVLAMRRQILGPEHPLVASALVDVAWAVGSSGKADESESLNLEALTMRRKLLGEDHPEVAKSLYLVGGGLWKQGKPVEAYSILTAALSIQRKLLGESNPATIDTLHCMGLVRASEGKFAEAENLHREALALWRARGDAESSQGLYELRSLIQVLMAQNKFNDAKTLLDQVLTSTFINKPESVDLLALRADLEGRLSQWRQSAADTALILEKKPTKSEFYAMQAALLIKANDRPAYETFRKRLLTSYAGTTNIFVGDQVAKACLFLPPSAADLPVISHLTEMAVTLGAGDDGAMPFFALGRALSEYREGHFAEAIEWAEKTLKSSRVEADGHAYAVLALANWQLGKKEEARIMLMNGNTLMPTIMPKRFSEDPGNAWLGWLFARVTLDEATALIQPASPADDNSKSP